jgi:hypothetical protein
VCKSHYVRGVIRVVAESSKSLQSVRTIGSLILKARLLASSLRPLWTKHRYGLGFIYLFSFGFDQRIGYQIPPPSHGMLAVELAVGGSLSGVAAASMTVNPSGFVNQASGNIAGSVIQSQKYASLEQRSFTPTAVSTALQFRPVAASSSGVPSAAAVPKIQNERAAAKIRTQLGRLAAEGPSSLPCFSKFIKTRLQKKIARIRTRKNIV